MIRLIASDIDGTLIREASGELYPEILDAIRKLKQAGVLFVVASGRQQPGLLRLFHEIESEIGFISENGALIRVNGEIIRELDVDYEIAKELVTALRKNPELRFIVSTARGALVESKDEEFLDLLENGYKNVVFRVDDALEALRVTTKEDGTQEREKIVKIACYRKGSIRELANASLVPGWSDRLQATMAGENWVDYMNPAVDKGSSLEFLEQTFGIAKEETAAFGDNANDMSMLWAAGIGYAVEDARPEVKACADRICPGWKDKGVYQALLELYPEILA